MDKRGFTLIELLVVIAIIGVLASIVLAALGGTRASARDAHRMLDMREIVKAIEIYYLVNGNYPRTADGAHRSLIQQTIGAQTFKPISAPLCRTCLLILAMLIPTKITFYYNTDDQHYYLYAELEGSDKADDGFVGCARIRWHK
jgi:prepilin-type N-terminal cleavage/methylation domain-containing protein